MSVGADVIVPKVHAFRGATGLMGGVSRNLLATPLGTVGVGVTGNYFKSEALLVCVEASCDLRQLASLVRADVSLEQDFNRTESIRPYSRAGIGAWTGHDSGAFLAQSSSENGIAADVEAGALIGAFQAGLGYQVLGGTRHGRGGVASIIMRIRV